MKLFERDRTCWRGFLNWVSRAFWLALLAFPTSGLAQQRPYFLTYSHEMEEPGSLELSFRNAMGRPHEGGRFSGGILEAEYGVKAWWTAEFSLDGASVAHDSTVFTGFRLESRFRPWFG